MRVAPRPILVYSKRATPEEKKAAMKAGAQGYQIEPHDLFNVAEHAVKGSSPGPQPGRGESLQPPHFARAGDSYCKINPPDTPHLSSFRFTKPAKRRRDTD